MIKETVYGEGAITAVLMDSISFVDEGDVGRAVVSASHGGVSSAEYAMRHRLGLALFNDAGVGKEDAGIAALALLEGIGVAACTIAHTSARIGDARDHWENGILSGCNVTATAAGLRQGLPVRTAVTVWVDAQGAQSA